MRIFAVDVDGTLFETDVTQGYDIISVHRDCINAVNKMYDEGNFIRIYTARGSGTGIDWSKKTLEQLVRHGVKFHEIRFSKENADYYVDDRAITPWDFIRRFGENNVHPAPDTAVPVSHPSD